MSISWFVSFDDAGVRGVFDDADRVRMRELLKRTPGLLRGHLFTPTMAGGPFSKDGPPPRLVLQLNFADLPRLEAAIGPEGILNALAAPEAWPSLAGTVATHQAMTARPFAVQGVGPAPAAVSGPACSYLVHYPGHAEDLNAWLLHYLAHHPQLMVGLPGIRAIEIFTRLDWCDGLPWRRVHHMQRNKLVFDSADALTAAMESPALHEMRADYRRFPPFVGGNLHYPMHTEIVAG